MTKTFARVLLGASTAVLAAGPFAAGAAASAEPPVYTHADSGKSVKLAHGTTFKVRLKGCGDCGLFWTISHHPDPGVVKQVGHKVVKPVAKPPAVGGYDHTTWTFKTVGNGATTMRMAEHDAKNHNKVVKRFKLTVQVTPKLAYAG